jgi:hypothetical protein
MWRFVVIAALAAGFALIATPGGAQTIDKNGRCHGPDGKFAKMEVCKPADSEKGSCRDKTTKKFAACSAPNTEPVPKAASGK